MGGVSAKEPDPDDEQYPNSKFDTVADTTGDAFKRFASLFPPGHLIVWFFVALVVLGIIIDVAGG